MSNGFLSQEEINSLLNGDFNEEINLVDEENEVLSEIERDLLGEVGNISMGSASTALYQLVNKQVNITTPVVSVTTLNKMKNSFDVPNMVLDVEYISGIVGRNILLMKITDAAIIANLMMGGDGIIDTAELSEIEISAVQEAMNQMIGSAATSMASMFMREVNISPPKSIIWRNKEDALSNDIDENEEIVKISFRLTIGDVLDSRIMQILPISTAKKIVSIMMGEDTDVNEVAEIALTTDSSIEVPIVEKEIVQEPIITQQYTVKEESKVEVQRASFNTLPNKQIEESHGNIDLILDVPLQVSVVLGRTKKSIRDILNLGNGSLIELDKLADEPVEILVNGKTIANGEVVVVDENFGVRITNIISGSERVKSLR